MISAPSENEVLHPDRCLKCAVVGNSGNLLHYNYGSLIDSHSIVIRCVLAHVLQIVVFYFCDVNVLFKVMWIISFKRK